MNTEKHLKKYIEACQEHGYKTDNNTEDYRSVNRAYKALIKYFRILVQNETGKAMLKDLIACEDKYVSSWTASLLIFEYPEECEPVIKEAMEGKGVCAASMRTFYDEWKKGRLKRQY